MRPLYLLFPAIFWSFCIYSPPFMGGAGGEGLLIDDRLIIPDVVKRDAEAVAEDSLTGIKTIASLLNVA